MILLSPLRRGLFASPVKTSLAVIAARQRGKLLVVGRLAEMRQRPVTSSSLNWLVWLPCL